MTTKTIRHAYRLNEKGQGEVIPVDNIDLAIKFSDIPAVIEYSPDKDHESFFGKL